MASEPYMCVTKVGGKTADYGTHFGIGEVTTADGVGTLVGFALEMLVINPTPKLDLAQTMFPHLVLSESLESSLRRWWTRGRVALTFLFNALRFGSKVVQASHATFWVH